MGNPAKPDRLEGAQRSAPDEPVSDPFLQATGAFARPSIDSPEDGTAPGPPSLPQKASPPTPWGLTEPVVHRVEIGATTATEGSDVLERLRSTTSGPAPVIEPIPEVNTLESGTEGFTALLRTLGAEPGAFSKPARNAQPQGLGTDPPPILGNWPASNPPPPTEPLGASTSGRMDAYPQPPAEAQYRPDSRTGQPSSFTELVRADAAGARPVDPYPISSSARAAYSSRGIPDGGGSDLIDDVRARAGTQGPDSPNLDGSFTDLLFPSDPLLRSSVAPRMEGAAATSINRGTVAGSPNYQPGPEPGLSGLFPQNGGLLSTSQSPSPLYTPASDPQADLRRAPNPLQREIVEAPSSGSGQVGSATSIYDGKRPETLDRDSGQSKSVRSPEFVSGSFPHRAGENDGQSDYTVVLNNSRLRGEALRRQPQPAAQFGGAPAGSASGQSFQPSNLSFQAPVQPQYPLLSGAGGSMPLAPHPPQFPPAQNPVANFAAGPPKASAPARGILSGAEMMRPLVPLLLVLIILLLMGILFTLVLLMKQ